MAKDVDLSSKEWTDLVFEGKNKEFGAYALRQDSQKRHTKSVIVVLSIILAAVVIIVLSLSGVFDKPEDVGDADTEMTSVDMSGAEEIEEEVVEEIPYIEPDEPDIPEEVPVDEDINSIALSELNLVDKAEKDKEVKEAEEVLESTATVSTKTNDGIDDMTKAAVRTDIVDDKPKEVVAQPKHEEPVNMAMVEQKPQFPGGEAAMYKWLGENINYPAQASEEGVQGKVTVQFVVEKDGSISGVKVARGKHPALDAEAVRVIKKMPKWTPGRNNGQPVRVTYLLPVTFRLQ